MGEASPETPRRRTTVRRVALYTVLISLIGGTYLVSHYGVIPGYDPYFAPRQNVDADIYTENGRRYLWGGDRPDQRFDITDFHLNPKRLEYGLGRERIHAPIKPEFVGTHRANTFLPDNSRVLVAKVGDEVKVYPLAVMRHFEVVNDTIGGRPIFAAYCLLANLGAIYERDLEGVTYTFAVSGYTYYDWKTWNGFSAFVLWDRETESLWWPPIGKAVSGPSIDIPMKVLDHALWAQTTWGEVKARYPHARVLSYEQSVTATEDWPRMPPPQGVRSPGNAPKWAIAPRWGENSNL